MSNARSEKAIQIAFGKAVKRFRADAELSQEELAAKAGIHRNYVGNVERGEKNVCLRTIFKLSRVLKTTPSGMMQEAERQLGGT